jgi:hypothetical protein
MKKYVIVSLLCLTSLAFAQGHVGENGQDSGNLCNSPQVTNCEPCLKACVQQHKSDRVGANDKASPKAAIKGTSQSGSTRQ